MRSPRLPAVEPASPHITFDREEWARLRENTPLTLSDEELARLRGLNERVSLDEVVDIYLPLSRLLNLQAVAAQGLHQATDTFLGKPAQPIPYVIAIAGSVAVGKSTVARILRALLSRWPTTPTVERVGTDSFLYPNAELTRRGLMERKGFPESYDMRRLLRFMSEIKSGQQVIRAPIYSHLAYDILEAQEQILKSPDIVIVEGLNVLQVSPAVDGANRPFVSDYFDFSIYVDAAEEHIERWFLERFMTLRETAFRDPHSYFRKYAEISADDALEFARDVWKNINGRNLAENILRTRERARLVLIKGADHSVRTVRLRKI
ncbi:MAG TPA: type I pantothenate kinase [Candidatus Acidoferrales bacterium]|nr:type I pantothenate kinase [Candidatus Acidoferrales bacterium]